MIGLGIMGSAMSMNLIRADYRVIGYDVLDKARRAHARAGGQVAESAADVAAAADIIVTSLPSADAVLATADGIARAGRRGQIVVETSTMPIGVK